MIALKEVKIPRLNIRVDFISLSHSLHQELTEKSFLRHSFDLEPVGVECNFCYVGGGHFYFKTTSNVFFWLAPGRVLEPVAFRKPPVWKC